MLEQLGGRHGVHLWMPPHLLHRARHAAAREVRSSVFYQRARPPRRASLALAGLLTASAACRFVGRSDGLCPVCTKVVTKRGSQIVPLEPSDDMLQASSCSVRRATRERQLRLLAAAESPNVFVLRRSSWASLRQRYSLLHTTGALEQRLPAWPICLRTAELCAELERNCSTHASAASFSLLLCRIAWWVEQTGALLGAKARRRRCCRQGSLCGSGNSMAEAAQLRPP